MDVKLPKLGEGADSGVVVNVFVKEGDTIAKDQTILELENEKAVASIPSSAGGVVTKIFVKPGDKLSVGQRIISIAESGKPATAARTEDVVPEPEIAETPPADETEEDMPKRVAAPVASPSIRKLARELGIDLSRVRGSEPGGRVVLGDLRAYVQRLQKVTEKPKAGVAHHSTCGSTS